jgi:hypothetical protein
MTPDPSALIWCLSLITLQAFLEEHGFWRAVASLAQQEG